MKKPTQEFSRVTDAQNAALDGLRSYTEKVHQERELALLKCDLEWEAEKRHFEPKPEHQFHYGVAAPRLTPVEYRKLRADYLERRQGIVNRYDDKAKDIRRVKEDVLDRFNERSAGRDGGAGKVLSRGHRNRLRNKDRGR